MKFFVRSVFLICLLTTIHAFPLIKGLRGVYVYDATYPNGPLTHASNDPGQWAANILAFNSAATADSNKLQRIYPYGGDIEFYCTPTTTSVGNCVFSADPSKANAHVYFSFGTESVQHYETALKDTVPHLQMLPIFDGTTSKGSVFYPLLTSPPLAVATAAEVASKVCSDPNDLDGVMFDLEPLEINNQALRQLFTSTAADLSKDQCINTTHPSGRAMGVFISVSKVNATTNGWQLLRSALGSNGYAIVSGYDMGSSGVPLQPGTYGARLSGNIQLMDAAATKYKIPYVIALPASASFSEFQEIGTYDTSEPGNFKLVKDYSGEGITQLGYIKSATTQVGQDVKSSYFLGIDFWSYNQYVALSTTTLLKPNILSGEVAAWLEQHPIRPG